jgi:hypothetical protein
MPKTNALAALVAAGFLLAAPLWGDIAGLPDTQPSAGLFTIHENLHPGQKLVYLWTDRSTLKTHATVNDPLVPKDSDTAHSWKLTLTIRDVKDGSAIRSVADVDPQSTDTITDDQGNQIKTPTAYAGKSIVLTRHPDDSCTNDFSGNASDDDVQLINNFVTPDAEWYPDKPVAVGDTWDDSAKVGKYASLGPKDTVISKGRLDWVKPINGKQIAQISHSIAFVYHEQGGAEQDYTFTGVQLVDLATGVTIQTDQKGSSRFIDPTTTPPNVLGGTEFMDHEEVLSDSADGPTRQP